MKDTVNSVSCPQARSTQAHRKRLQKWWHSKEWKEYVRVNTEGKRCVSCGCEAGQVKGDRKPAVLTVNHLYRDLYNSFDDYLKFAEGLTEVTCTSCNWMYEKGMDICPKCLTDKVAKYKHWYEPMCRACYIKLHPEVAEAREKKRRERNELKKSLTKKARENNKKRKCSSLLQKYKCGVTFCNIKNCGKCRYLVT